MKLKLDFAVILAAGYFTFTPFLAKGAQAGYLSAPHDRRNEAQRFIHPLVGILLPWPSRYLLFRLFVRPDARATGLRGATSEEIPCSG